MSAPRLLWRLTGAIACDPAEPPALTEGLRLHLRYADLSSVLVQIGARQQAYVVVRGCEGCRHGRCVLGCRADLLRRTLLSGLGDAVELRLAPQGLARRPYRQALLLWPGCDAQPLTASLLAGWPEARLAVAWSRGLFAADRLRVAGLLLVGAGAHPRLRLARLGWRSLSLPGSWLARWLAQPLPLPLPFHAPWVGEPSLLLPAPAPLLLPAPGDHPQEPTTPAQRGRVSMPLLSASPEPEPPGGALAESVRRWLEAIRDRRPLPTPQPVAPTSTPHAPATPSAPPREADDDDTDPAIPAQAQAGISDEQPGDSAQVTAADASTGVADPPPGEPAQATAAQASTGQTDTPPVAPIFVAGIPEETNVPVGAGPGEDQALSPSEAGVDWPPGPGQMQPEDVAQLIELCLTSPTFVGGERPGVIKKRLGAVLPIELTEHSAPLMVWLGRAGVLADPPVPDEPWRNPRPLRCGEHGWIAAQLAATPIPSLAEAQIALRQQTP